MQTKTRYLVVLRLGNISQRLGRRVHNVEQLDDRRAVVRDRHLLAVVNELVHAARAERRLQDLADRLARIDVAD